MSVSLLDLVRQAQERLGRSLASWRATAPTGAANRRLWIAVASVCLVTLGLGVLWKGTGYAYASLDREPVPRAATPPEDVKKLSARAKTLRARLARTEPRQPYIVVGRTHNRLFLKTNSKMVLQAVCSVGSGAFLAEPDGDREWTFATPRGRFQVLSKLRNPVWKKPDWAFIEEGEPLPKNPGDRFEYGTLGEFGLYFGDGYLIHGTLYERLLGRSVSHGCVRLGRDDLRALYAATRVGTPIYIF
jgi:L,D-transpeptidase ErfK/SrfK